MRKRAFTLLELLVVVAIVGALAALLMSVVLRFQAQGAAAKCLSNLRQWGVARNLFAGDHEGFVPRRGQGVQQVVQIERPEDWFNGLPPYLGVPSYAELAKKGGRLKATDQSIFVCPSAVDDGGPHFLPYAMNMYLSPWIRPEPHRQQEIEDWPTLVFMADGPGGWASTLPSTLPFSLPARHSNCANILFLDGHAAAFDGKYLGCKTGDPHRVDVRWETGTAGINQTPLP